MNTYPKPPSATLDIVVPCHNESGNIIRLIQEIDKYCDVEHNVIFVDDGSVDDTIKTIKTIAKNTNNIKYIKLSRNFGHQAALRAGIFHSKGDAVITMDADLQHPPKLIPELLKRWREGYEIVYTKRDDGKDIGLMKRLTSRWYYTILNKLSGLEISLGAADYRLLDSKVVSLINDMPEKQLFFRGFVAWCGFNQFVIPYTPAKRFSGKSSYTYKKMLSLALQGITSFSVKPLKLATFAGFITALMGVIYGIYAMLVYLFTDNTIDGWTSVTIIVLLLGGSQLMILGIIGEYLGRMYIETKQRPDYIIMEDNL